MSLTDSQRKLILGARYKHPSGEIWPLTPWSYWNAQKKVVKQERFPFNATEPHSVNRPPLEVVTTGVNGFSTSPVMGSDPEVFVSRGATRVPAFEVLPDKHTAKAAEDDKKSPFQHNWFWDGFQAETLLSAYGCHTSFAQMWQAQLRKLMLMGLSVHPSSVWKVPTDALERAGETEVGLGCSPSYNAYGMRGRVVENPRALKYRFAGGHIHFGCALKELEELSVTAPYIVKALDCFLGVPSVALFQNYDSPIRRRYYGLAGEFRTPPHGLEYRTLSNGWLLHPQSFQLVLDLARHAFNLGRTRLRRVWVGREELVRDIINYNDVRGARDLMKLNREFYDAWLVARYSIQLGCKCPDCLALPPPDPRRNFWNAINGGIEETLKGFGEDIYKAWGVSEGNAKVYEGAYMWQQLK